MDLYDEENPIDQWITKEEGSHVLEGLTAGATYLLLEKKAPEGYERMQPYVFTLSEDGRQICAVSGQMGVVTVHPHEKGGGIRLVELQGRYGVKVEMELLHLDERLMSLKVDQLVVMVEKVVVLFLKLQPHYQHYWI